jgi:WD40 repeat protein
MINAAVDLTGHAKKVLSVNWHHILNNTLATTSFDNTVRVWDVENQVAKLNFTKVPNCATCLRWSPDGAKLSLNCKTGKFLVFDVRQNNEIAF